MLLYLFMYRYMYWYIGLESPCIGTSISCIGTLFLQTQPESYWLMYLFMYRYINQYIRIFLHVSVHVSIHQPIHQKFVLMYRYMKTMYQYIEASYVFLSLGIQILERRKAVLELIMCLNTRRSCIDLIHTILGHIGEKI